MPSDKFCKEPNSLKLEKNKNCKNNDSSNINNDLPSWSLDEVQ